MFTENCIVLTEGEMVDGQFRVKIMGFLPPQQRTESLEAIGTFDCSAGHHAAELAKMQESSSRPTTTCSSSCPTCTSTGRRCSRSCARCSRASRACRSCRSSCSSATSRRGP